MFENEEIICPSCGKKWDFIDELWPSISIETEMVKITDFFCKEPACGKILYGYTKEEWKI